MRNVCRLGLGFSICLLAVLSAASAQARLADMKYGGGPLVHSHRLHLIFLQVGKGYDSVYQQKVTEFFSRDLVSAGARADNVYGLLSEYRIRFDLQSVDAATVTPAPGVAIKCPRALARFYCLDPGGIGKIADARRAALGLQPGLSDIYLLALPRGSAYCMFPGACVTTGTEKTIMRGEHHFAGSAKKPILWGLTTNRLNYDEAINTLVHEHLETITDPVYMGWTSPDFGEMDDVCKLPFRGSLQQIGEGTYWLERPWSNHFHRCVMDSSGRSYPLIPPRPQTAVPQT